jgi:hypothetical protein
MMPLLGSEL